MFGIIVGPDVYSAVRRQLGGVHEDPGPYGVSFSRQAVNRLDEAGDVRRPAHGQERDSVSVLREQPIHVVLVESPEQTQRRRLVDWIAGRGGQVTVRELSHGPREYRNKEVAEAALADLVAAGVGVFNEKKSGEKGGRPTKVFVLNLSCGTGTETPHSSLEDEGFRCQQRVVEPGTTSSADGVKEVA